MVLQTEFTLILILIIGRGGLRIDWLWCGELQNLISWGWRVINIFWECLNFNLFYRWCIISILDGLISCCRLTGIYRTFIHVFSLEFKGRNSFYQFPSILKLFIARMMLLISNSGDELDLLLTRFLITILLPSLLLLFKRLLWGLVKVC